MTVIGSGIMGERLSQGNEAIALLANSIATGCALYVLILVFGPVSGAHFNPAVTLCMAWDKRIGRYDAVAYIVVQIISAFAGVAIAHLMFGEEFFTASVKIRSGGAQWLGEFVATFGLVTIIWGCMRQNITTGPAAVACYITAAYWFTSSTSFANPAVAVARAYSDSFAGIRPEDVAAFILAQLAGAAVASAIARFWAPG